MSDSPEGADVPVTAKRSRKTNGQAAKVNVADVVHTAIAVSVSGESDNVKPFVDDSAPVAAMMEVMDGTPALSYEKAPVEVAAAVTAAVEVAPAAPPPEVRGGTRFQPPVEVPVAAPAPPIPLSWFDLLPFANASAPDGFEQLPPSLVYSAEANDWQPVEGMAADVREWGGGVEMIVLRPKAAMRVRLYDGSIVEVPAKTPVAVPAVNELMGLLSAMQEHPKEGFACWFVPTARRRLENGRELVHYRVMWNRTGIPRHMLWGDGA